MGHSLVGISTFPSLVACFSLTGTLVMMVGNSAAYYFWTVRQILIFSVTLYNFNLEITTLVYQLVVFSWVWKLQWFVCLLLPTLPFVLVKEFTMQRHH